MFEAVTVRIEGSYIAVAPYWQVDCAPISVHRLTELIVWKDEHRRFGSTILRVWILERSGENGFAGMGAKRVREGIVAFP